MGAGKWKILGICFGEAVVLCAAVDLLGIGIHWMLYDSVFSKLNKEAALVYLPEDYLWIFLSMLCVGVVVALGFVVKYAALSPAASRRHAEKTTVEKLTAGFAKFGYTAKFVKESKVEKKKK